MKAMGQKGPCLCLVHFVKTCFWQSFVRTCFWQCVSNQKLVHFGRTCCGHILLARNLLLSKPCHHLINLTSDSPGARSVTPSLPRTPNFNVGADGFFFCLVSPLSTLRFGGAGGNGAHHTSEVKIITGLDKVKVTHAIYWTSRQYIVDAQGLFVFVSQDLSTLLPPHSLMSWQHFLNK